MDVAGVIAGVGPRLRRMRTDAGRTLADVSAATGISVSTLSRLESGGRKATLELLLPLTEHFEVGLDELVRPARRPAPRKRTAWKGMTFVPLSAAPGGLRAYKQVLEPGAGEDSDEQNVHEGYEWIYVMSGRLRMRLGSDDFEVAAGESAEFDTRLPHRVSNPGPAVVECLVVFGAQGERIHVRARPKVRSR
ncbi:helix-turn-helix domain-containing protein [Kineococcus rhizosphaerae]|uniref:XRE family transcriptional regulator n=1 Tax=Kineococcus rhizosphaerae TaxID=559628 RepID=A0A2T0R2T6_9ACTN|nr:XRE family transcriptional regulator [Kineococcus rhizosphaerae]PRY14127.1 XRE family transcriptional regulator [Kineococcus rhizosphaerae]